MISKTWLTGLNDVQKAINNIFALSTTANGATHLFSNSAVVQQYANALNGLNKEQALLALSYKNHSLQQKEQILSQMGLIASENTIQSELLQTTLAQKGVSAEKSKAILVELGLMNAETGEILSQKACTKADLEAILAQKGITGAQAEGIISALGLSGANTGLTASFGLLGKAIWGVTKALLSNPITWIVVGFAGLVAITDALTTSTEEYKEQLDDLKNEHNEITSEIQSVNSELKTTIERMKEVLHFILQKLNKYKTAYYKTKGDIYSW